MNEQDNNLKEEFKQNENIEVKEDNISEGQLEAGDISKNKPTKQKKEKRPNKIELSDKSELFKSIIDIALAYEKMEIEYEKLTNINNNLADEIKDLKEQKEEIKEKLEETELLCKKKETEINNLKADIDHRNEVIQIQKVDKVESAQEFKNALAASLKTYMQDFNELKSMNMTEEVGSAMVDTLEGVFKILYKNGINI